MKKIVIALLTMTPALAVAQPAPLPKPELTEFWSPVPPKVAPGRLPGDAPSDATLLFNGRDLSGWESVNGGPANWSVENGEMVIQPKSGSIQTTQKFGDCQLHVEWMVPVLPPERKGQDRGNSGVYLQGLYELQVLDSQVQRQLDYEYVADGEPNPETEFRHYDLDEEFSERDKRDS